jgi:hypothetical protein
VWTTFVGARTAEDSTARADDVYMLNDATTDMLFFAWILTFLF